ncbi:cysteine-rich secretory family protein (macronuclear) [Tetrahymena thermophila SB210]|uniref:Cysteine-rich secretory family protein n=1 Tax=Tetrahymena thermophila (strain SB210) TaxID=312017 RepID=I7MDY6_TETTS|nr:cysteine-rich secretory family protein [Tetrahymena thermophila SB210]EAR92960.2 cysteine-rich secretory family protein [Tetrahymena thermophila SB210]|eukprot:XP_001013205.2 cysteine-rich secretory family protein [Tetrahymena thermophila SB210]
MEFLNRFSQDFQIKLFQFTPNELKLFFDIHFWLKEETDEAKIEETLKKFYPQHFLKENVLNIPKDSVFFSQNEPLKDKNNQIEDKFDTQNVIERLYQFLQACEEPSLSKKIIQNIINIISSAKQGEIININFNELNQQNKSLLVELLKSIQITQIQNNSFLFQSSSQATQYFIHISKQLVQDIDTSFIKENASQQIFIQNMLQQERVQSQYQALEKRQILDKQSKSLDYIINDKDNDPLIDLEEDQQKQQQDDDEKRIIFSQNINVNQNQNKFEEEQNIQQQQMEMIEEISDEEIEEIKQKINQVMQTCQLKKQFMQISHLIIFKMNPLKEGDSFELDLDKFQNKNQIVELLESIGVFNIQNNNYGLFTTPQKFGFFKQFAKNLIEEVDDKAPVSEIQQNQNKANEQFIFEEQKLLENLYLVIQAFEGQAQSVNQIKFIIQKIQQINEGEKFQLNLSLFSDEQKRAIFLLFESLGIFEINANIFQLFSSNQNIQLFVSLSNELLNDMQSQINQIQNGQQPIGDIKQINDRAQLTKLAQQRKKQQNYQDSPQTHAQISSREQMEEYRRNKRQKDLNKSRFTGKNIMTLERLEELEEKKYEFMNENPSAQVPNKVITMRDIENMTIAENLQKFGKQALEYTNQFRRQNNLPDLIWNNQLTFIGMKHSQNMAEGLVPFGHDGFNDRVRQITFSYRSVAENVAYCSAGYSNIPKTIVDGWINSPGHRKNMLSNSNVCGIAVYRNNKGFWYFTQLFALKV